MDEASSSTASLMNPVVTSTTSAPLVAPGSFLYTFLSVSPSLSALACFILPGITAWKMHKSRSTLSVPVLPFLSMATQCTVWLLYGLLEKSSTIIWPNAVGVALGVIYTAVYDAYASVSVKPSLRIQYLICVVILLIVGACLAIFPLDQAAKFIGFIAAAGSVCFTASPLIAVATVLKTNSVESMPLTTSAILFTNGILWSSFGLAVANDPAIYVPNVLGAFAGTVQLLVHLYIFAKGVPAPMYEPVPTQDTGDFGQKAKMSF